MMMTYRDDILEVGRQPLPWEQLSGCNLLVTGATGLLGECLVDVLMSRQDKDYQVWASGRDEERARKIFARFMGRDTHFHFLPWDVTQPLALDVPFHYIIHAASPAAPHSFSTQPVETMLSNILGVHNLMAYGIHHGMKRMLYVSSGEVYGEGDGRDFTEEYSGYVNPLQARSCYPNSKRAAETLCAAYGQEYGAEYVIARPCHTYGPHFTAHDNRVYAQFIRNVLRGEDIVMKSTGQQYRSWCYVPDTVAGLLFILLKGTAGEAYNIADPTSDITIRQLADMVAAIGGREVIIQSPDIQEQAGYNPVQRSSFCTDRLCQLGWHPQGTMREKMLRTIETLMKNE